MSGSYIALLTGCYVDNGPNLPLWNRRAAGGWRRSGAQPGRPG
jgi:hypothetical protein